MSQRPPVAMTRMKSRINPRILLLGFDICRLPSTPFAFQRKLETSLSLEWRICAKRMLEFTIFDICVVFHEKIEHLDLSFKRASLSILAQLAAAFKTYHSGSSCFPSRMHAFFFHHVVDF